MNSLCGEAKLSDEESKGVVAALNFILANSVKYDVDSEIVCNELQQLGLPKGNQYLKKMPIHKANFDIFRTFRGLMQKFVDEFWKVKRSVSRPKCQM